jgi:hypothetical protein
MAQLNAEQIVAHLKSIERELINNRDEYDGGSSGATWLKNRMLGRAAGYLEQAIADLNTINNLTAILMPSAKILEPLKTIQIKAVHCPTIRVSLRAH